ncbi:MAG: hypothetical protein EAZ57_03705 [Cytophagales bacterium]|nr:MAG: hypothetical protein EAZ67_04715 [Cytophagales bacterium]TAF61316.1 MAG: hypothetical protein EAZ57_03705 [Cytophagales bacterium]
MPFVSKALSFLIFLGWIMAVQPVWSQSKLTTAFERSQGLETATYEEGIAFFDSLANQHSSKLKFIELGYTDSGYPLLLAVLSVTGLFDPAELRALGKTIILINNNIHPGEPDGVDASMLLFRDYLSKPEYEEMLQKVVVICIPFYNVDGTLNRNSHSRANQIGPLSYGFRGNALNLDLNRDFIKADSKNARTFFEIFHTWKPDLYLEPHVTNGADYQHVMTYLLTQEDKLGGQLSRIARNSFAPFINRNMAEKGFQMCPYVNVWGTTPDKGMTQFLETPRYSSGYAALFQTMGLVLESHMLKPFKQRVEATYALLQESVLWASLHSSILREARSADRDTLRKAQKLPISWQNDPKGFEEITFLGYEGQYKKSAITGKERLFYNHTKPFAKKIPFYNRYVPSEVVIRPKSYIVSASWTKLIELLEINRVKIEYLEKDSVLNVTSYYITDYKTVQQPYEGHYLHYQTKVRSEKQKILFKKGDIIIPTDQDAVRYVVETLEPSATDSFFNWNFFDSILQQKEGFSDYVFEDIAEKLLVENNKLRNLLEKQKKKDPALAQDPLKQLDFIYRNSIYYEKSHNRYPVFRVEY